MILEDRLTTCRRFAIQTSSYLDTSLVISTLALWRTYAVVRKKKKKGPKNIALQGWHTKNQISSLVLLAVDQHSGEALLKISFFAWARVAKGTGPAGTEEKGRDNGASQQRKTELQLRLQILSQERRQSIKTKASSVVQALN